MTHQKLCLVGLCGSILFIGGCSSNASTDSKEAMKLDESMIPLGEYNDYWADKASSVENCKEKAMLPLDEYNACWSSDASSEN